MKEWLLAKSNIRKAKGFTVGLTVLIILAALFTNIMLVIFMDYQKNANREAKRLNSEDAQILITGEVSKADDEYLKRFVNDDVEDYEISKELLYVDDLKFADGTASLRVLLNKKDNVIDHKIGRTEIVEEDKLISEKFIYLPYQFFTGGKIKIGDEYKLKIHGEERTFRVKGFYNNILNGSSNCGLIRIIVDDDTYEEFDRIMQDKDRAILMRYKLKDGVDSTKFGNTMAKKIDEGYSDVALEAASVFSQDLAISSRTFMGTILGVSFALLTIIIILVVLFMVSNTISNFIKENIKTIGALKSIGYCSNNIINSFMMQFGFMGFVGSIIGVATSYLLIPSVLTIITAETGIPYAIRFIPSCSIYTIVAISFIVILNAYIFTKKVKKIDPITALREGVQTHNFKKNRIELEKSKIPVNFALAIKTMFTNIKQNVVTFFVVFLLVFAGVIALVLYQNFSVKQNISVFTFEICNGAVAIDNDEDKELLHYIENYKGVYNTRLMNTILVENGDAKLYVYVTDNCDKMRNQDVCYKGRLPKYDNEIVISGKYGETYGYKIGDEIEIELTKSNKKIKYIISGFIQTTNNDAKEAMMISEGVAKLESPDKTVMYYFDTEEGVDVNKCLDDIKNKFGDRIITTVNFDEIVSGSISLFKTIANAMVIVVSIISALVIFLVMYLLIKTLIIGKKKDYGILKAVGYTSKDVVLQNAVSFMPAIIISVIISCIVSSLIANPYIGLMMKTFGVMKLTFTVPVNLVIIMGFGFVVLSFIFAIILSLKIRKIEPYKLISED